MIAALPSSYGSQIHTLCLAAAEGGAAVGGMGAGGADPGCDYSSPNTCTTAVDLGSLAGDENNPPVVVTGVTSEWFQIQITEEVGSIFEEDLSYTVTLASPPGMDWDLIVHQGPQNGSPNCGATPQLGQGSGGTESVSNGWDDDQGIGGEDDDVWLSIEVRHVDGVLCGDDAEWTLSIQGHT